MSIVEAPFPETVTQHGVTVPYYLDEESIRALEHDETLCLKANWLVHIGKANNRIPKGEEIKRLEALVHNLKKAKRAYDSLANNDKARIGTFFELDGGEKIQVLIEQAEECIEEPLASKHALENLYWTFRTTGKESWRKIGRDDMPTPFMIFMAVVVRLVEDQQHREAEELVPRVSKAYKRYVLGQI